MLFLASKMQNYADIFNLGNVDSTKVTAIAKIVIEEMGLPNVKLRFTGGQTGWRGDIAKTILDISKAQSRGWSPSLHSDDAVRRSAREIIKNMKYDGKNPL